MDMAARKKVTKELLRPPNNVDRLQRRDDLLKYGAALAEVLRRRPDYPTTNESDPLSTPASKRVAHTRSNLIGSQ
jgi:hypothetical protein